MPVELLTDAINALLLFHVPPPLTSLSEVVLPAQMNSVPSTGGGGVVTATTAETVQPEPTWYTTVAVPGVMPVTTPDAEPMLIVLPVALQVPPVGISLNVIVVPGHTAVAPMIADGNIDTDTVVVALQPSGSV